MSGPIAVSREATVSGPQFDVSWFVPPKTERHSPWWARNMTRRAAAVLVEELAARGAASIETTQVTP